MILAGDIGGTKTHLALFDGNECIREEKFPSKGFKSLEEIILKFGIKHIDKACFGIAGPVFKGVCKTTNLPWLVDESTLAKRLSIPKVKLINDLEATAWGISRLKPDELFIVNRGKKENGNRAILAAGTGLGEAGMYWDGKRHLPFSCEGGHVDFAPRNEREFQLWHYLKKKYEHVSYERILSGPGLEHLFWFLIENGFEKEEIEGSNLPHQITQRGVKGNSKVCQEVVEWFCSIYGSAAGNLALKMMAIGGIYLGGGIAPHIVPILEKGEFMHSFTCKGRFESILCSIPVTVILNDNAALLGASQYAIES